jgi:heme-degrading monooxygenase HmoA
MEFEWKSFGDPDPETELLGVVGEIRPARYRTVPRVLQSTRRIESQLADSDGLVGYSLRASFLSRRFWAVSVWEGEKSLQNFVTTEPHAEIMAALKGGMETSRFDRFAVRGEEVPIGVDDAIARAT